MESSFSKIILKQGKERSLLNFHPWLFSGAIAHIEGEAKEGDIVEVFSHDKRYLATGHYHEGSITVRVFSFEQVSPGKEFWKKKITNAFELRQRLGLTDNSSTNAYRLVHAEGDGAPGLIIDIYNTAAVIQTHTLGMHHAKSYIADALKEIYGSGLQCIYDKSADTMSKQNQGVIENKFLFGEMEDAVVTENGIKFHIDFKAGQKTGFFIDQRENRKLLGQYAKGKKVLNTFSYSGGFSLYALKEEAALVHSVDSSKRAAEWTEQNMKLNSDMVGNNHTFYTQDVFDFLKSSQESYDVIVLDPPAFAKHLSSVNKATIGYRNLNCEAIKRINRGGILFTFSCSQVIDKALFRKIIFTAAAMTKRNVRILHQLTQPADHPISLYHPEGEYLKGLVLYVD
jgi:23S rRNA (cytosine1962-C5)-methyltransferase